MSAVKAGVVVFPGSNCDADTLHALEQVAGIKSRFVWHTEKDLSDLGLVVLPGGFSYGDYLRAGSIARFSPVMDAVVDMAQRQTGLIMGICNGFQILTEAGLLPGALARNTSQKFVCKTVSLVVENSNTPFTSEYKPSQTINLPIAHAEGRYVLNQEELEELEASAGVVFRYHGENPNGSVNNIAGVIKNNVLGMMPHPERNCESLLGDASGLALFLSLKKHLG